MNVRVLGVGFVLLAAALMFGQIGLAEAKVDEGAVEDQLQEIQKKLDDIKAQQETLIAGIKQLSEEHKQIRYFIHKS